MAIWKTSPSFDIRLLVKSASSHFLATNEKLPVGCEELLWIPKYLTLALALCTGID